MTDLANPSDIPESEPLTAGQIQTIINQIDLQIRNLVSGGKWELLPHAEFGNVGKKDEPDKLLEALQKQRDYYQNLLNETFPFEEVTVHDSSLG